VHKGGVKLTNDPYFFMTDSFNVHACHNGKDEASPKIPNLYHRFSVEISVCWASKMAQRGLELQHVVC
jgi:hypothetical protein